MLPDSPNSATPLGRVVAWLRHALAEPLLLGVALALNCGVWGFLKLADAVRESGTLSWDDRLLLMLRRPGAPGEPRGPAWLSVVVRDLSAMGGPLVMSIVVGSVCGYLFILGHRRSAWRLAVAAGGGALAVLLKHTFSRPRPGVVPHLMDATSTSFPSGHSMMSAVVYVTLGVMIARLTPSVVGRVYVLLVVGAVSVLVGFSRVYLGVHYPSDVVAGWAAGLVWGLVYFFVLRWFSSRP